MFMISLVELCGFRALCSPSGALEVRLIDFKRVPVQLLVQIKSPL